MPDARKISELPERSSVGPNDILPIVDENRNATNHCRASQISLLGGGPPGDETVLERHMTNGAVTAIHAGFAARERIIVSNDLSQQGTPNGNNYSGREIPCTNYAQGFFEQANSTAALQYLGGLQSTVNPYFQGQVRFDDGTYVLPSITNFNDTATGIYFPFQATIGFTADGTDVAIFSNTGLRTRGDWPASFTNLLPHVGARAWAQIDGTSTAAFTLGTAGNVAARYGQWPGTLLNDATTRAYITQVELNRSIAVSIPVPAPQVTDGRTNYTTPSNNTHYRWVQTGATILDGVWQTAGATGNQWIGQMTVTPTTALAIKRSDNIAAVTFVSTGTYRITFAQAMPHADYAVVIAARTQPVGNPRLYSYDTKTVSSVDIQLWSSTSQTANADDFSVAIFC